MHGGVRVWDYFYKLLRKKCFQYNTVRGHIVFNTLFCLGGMAILNAVLKMLQIADTFLDQMIPSVVASARKTND